MQISNFAFDICTYHFKDVYVIEVIYIKHARNYTYIMIILQQLKNIITITRNVMANENSLLK
jgi:hypothetical protein